MFTRSPSYGNIGIIITAVNRLVTGRSALLHVYTLVQLTVCLSVCLVLLLFVCVCVSLTCSVSLLETICFVRCSE